MLIKKFKYILLKHELKKYKKIIINSKIKLPNNIDKNSFFLSKWKGLNYIFKTVIQEIQNGIFYYIIFYNEKDIGRLNLRILKEVSDFFGIHLIIFSKKNYYIYQNTINIFDLYNDKKNFVKLDKRLNFLSNNDLEDITVISYIYLNNDNIIFTSSRDEELIQNFSNASFSIVINKEGKIFKPVVFDDMINLSNNKLKINFKEINILKEKINQNDFFSKKVYNILKK